MNPELRRRDFLKLTLGAAGAALGQSCAQATPPAPASTQQPATAKPAQVPAAPVPATAAPAPTAVPTQAPAAATKAAGPKRGGTFTLARTAGIVEFNPFSLLAGHYHYQRALYNSLARYDFQLNLQPDLAEKWDISPDGKTVTFKLRQGVKFHTGREFTSDDVKASVQFGQTNERSIMASLFKTIKQVETPDKYTVAFKFDSVNPGVFDLVDALWIIDKNTIEDRAKTAVGTGPFKLDKYIPSDRAEFVAFAGYWEKGKPYLDRYVLREIPDVAALVLNLESGAVDSIYWPGFLDVVRLRDQAGGKFTVDLGAPGPSQFDIAVNCKQPPLDNKKVRQAIAWSIDRERFVKSVLQSISQATCLIWPPHSWAYFKDLQGKIGYDLDKAKGLLKEAGLSSGFETELLVSSKQGFGLGELAIMLQADLKKIGVDAKVLDVEPAQYTARMQTKRDISLASHTYGRAGRDPGTTLTGAISWYTEAEGSWTRFESSEYVRLRKELQSTLDRDKRVGLCRQIQELMLDECPTIPVALSQRPWINASYVKDFSVNLDNSPYVGNFWLDR